MVHADSFGCITFYLRAFAQSFFEKNREKKVFFFCDFWVCSSRSSWTLTFWLSLSNRCHRLPHQSSIDDQLVPEACANPVVPLARTCSAIHGPLNRTRRLRLMAVESAHHRHQLEGEVHDGDREENELPTPPSAVLCIAPGRLVDDVDEEIFSSTRSTPSPNTMGGSAMSITALTRSSSPSMAANGPLR